MKNLKLFIASALALPLFAAEPVLTGRQSFIRDEKRETVSNFRSKPDFSPALIPELLSLTVKNILSATASVRAA